jgi:hypothetical protein
VTKEERQQRQARVAALRGRALQIVLSRGRRTGNFDRDGRSYETIEHDNRLLKIILDQLRAPIDDERFFTLEVKFEGVRLLRIKWDGGRSRVLDYRPGDCL